MRRSRKISRSIAADMNARLAHMPENDNLRLFNEDLLIAARLEDQDWHVDKAGREMLLRRAEALGVELEGSDRVEQFVNLMA